MNENWDELITALSEPIRMKAKAAAIGLPNAHQQWEDDYQTKRAALLAAIQKVVGERDKFKAFGDEFIWGEDNPNEYQSKMSKLESDLQAANEALLLCEPIVQQDWYESDTNSCFFCEEEIESGDEHKEDCKGVVAYLATHKALEPYRARVNGGG